jgi:signal transduction histidine kinase
MVARRFGAERANRLGIKILAALGIVILFGGLAIFGYYATLPFAGFELAGPVRIGAVVPDSPAETAGLQVGDQVLTMDVAPFRLGQAYLRPGQEILRLSVLRDEQVIPVEIALVRPSLKERFFTSSHLLVALAFWMVAMAVLAFKPREPVAHLFVLVTLLGVMALVVWLLADLGLAWANILMATVVVLIGPLFVHFHTLFPERSDFMGKRVLLVGLYVVAVVLLLLSTSSDLAYYLRLGSGNGWLASLPMTAVIEAFFSLCLLIGLMLLVRARLVAASETSRRRAALVFFGTALALLPFIVLIVIPQIFSAPYLAPTWLTLLALVLIPLSYVYAMYRRDLMKLDGTINRTVVFYLLALTLTGLYVGVSLGLQRLMPDASSGTITLTDAGLFIGLVLLVDPLKQRTQTAVDHVLYGGWYNYQSFISSTSEALGDAVDVPGISQLLDKDVVGTMRFKAVALLLSDYRGHTMHLRGGRGFDDRLTISPKGEVARFLVNVGRPVDHAALCDGFPTDSAARQELAAWSEAGARMWVPLVQQDELMGLLVLGSKKADDFVTQGDLDILNTLAQQVANAIRRQQLVERLQGQVEEVQALGRQILALQERNQHRLSRELHDLALQRLFVVRHLLEQTQEVFAPERIEEASATLLELADYLRSIMFELRAPAWDDTDLPTALEDYALNFEDRRGLPVFFQAHGDDPGNMMPDEVRTAVYRICQEGLNNAWKYAGAEQVEVTLDLQDGHLRLEVCDDGVGFEVPAHLGGYVSKGKLGLVSMRERAEEVGGTCEIESEQGQGTRIVVEVPLSLAQDAEGVE